MDKINFFREILGIKKQEILMELARMASVESLKKGELVMESGIPQGNLYFLIRGILRGFFVDVKGKDVTECFVFRYGQVALGAYRLDEAPNVSIIAETDAQVMKIPKQRIEELIQIYKELLQIYNEFLIREMKEHQIIKHAVYMFNARERYNWFLSQYENLIDQVSHKHIASFLNMTPVTLSRMRKEIHGKTEKTEKGQNLTF